MFKESSLSPWLLKVSYILCGFVREPTDEASISTYFEYLGQKGVLQVLNGIIIGKTNEAIDFSQRAGIIRQIVADKYSCAIPIIYGVNFGHSSPICVLPYGALAELDCEKKTFSIMESGVI